MNDAGKVAFTPKGDYNRAVTYEYLDTVVHDGNAYVALKTTTGNAPAEQSEYWALLARGGTSVPVATEDVKGAVRASNDIGVDSNAKMVLKTDFTEQTDLVEIQEGEGRASFFGKIAKAVREFITHIATEATAKTLGHVKLTNSVASTSTTTAAVPANVKSAYDKATAAVPKANISSSSAITTTGTHVLDAREKNASISGTLANQINLQKQSLTNLSATLNTKSRIIVEQVVITGNGGGWAVVASNNRKLIAAQSVRDDTRFCVVGIQKQTATGLYTLIFNEAIGGGSRQAVWLTWIDN